MEAGRGAGGGGRARAAVADDCAPVDGWGEQENSPPESPGRSDVASDPDPGFPPSREPDCDFSFHSPRAAAAAPTPGDSTDQRPSKRVQRGSTSAPGACPAAPTSATPTTDSPRNAAARNEVNSAAVLGEGKTGLPNAKAGPPAEAAPKAQTKPTAKARAKAGAKGFVAKAKAVKDGMVAGLGLAKAEAEAATVAIVDKPPFRGGGGRKKVSPEASPGPPPRPAQKRKRKNGKR